MKYYLWIIGCQYNEWDGARLKYFLDQNNLSESSPDDADVIIILACSVRQTAIDRIFGRIKNWQVKLKDGRTKEPKHNKLILITGCVLDDDRKKFAEKNIQFFDSEDFNQLIKYLPKTFGTKKTRNYKLETKNSPYVPIMIGCNNFCSYCAVPYVRGREKSRPVDEIIEDVKNLIKSGQKDIMLLGQNVNSYAISNRSVIPDLIGDPPIVDSRFDPRGPLRGGNDNPKLSDFTELLEKLNSLAGDFKIGFISNHPKDMTDDIIEAVARLPKIKKEIHLPLQSGSDKILKAMNRPYTAEKYLKIVKRIQSKVKNVRLTTDVIVGFPGETEKDFEKTVGIFKKVNFAQAYVNKYSPRSGTAAHKLGDPIPWSEKQHRWRILKEIANKK